MKKRILALSALLAMTVVLLCGCGTTASPAATETRLEFKSANAAPGDTVSVDVKVTKSAPLWGFSWEFTYDKTEFTVEDVIVSEKYEKQFEMTVSEEGNPLVIQGTGREIENYDVTGTVATLKLKLSKSLAPGSYGFTVSCKDGNNIDVDANDIPLVCDQACAIVVK